MQQSIIQADEQRGSQAAGLGDARSRRTIATDTRKNCYSSQSIAHYDNSNTTNYEKHGPLSVCHCGSSNGNKMLRFKHSDADLAQKTKR